MTDLIYKYNQGLPSSERFNLIDQMNRCSCSIPSKIAERSAKRKKSILQSFLSMSLSSAFELHTQLLIPQRRNYVKKEELDMCLTLTIELQEMISSFKGNFE